MKLFISWSGEASKIAALALKNIVPNVIQSVKVFVSDADIEGGTKWADVITSELNATSFGILCMTPENLNAPWIMFEAGCLSKGIDDQNRVIPLMFNIDPSDLVDPLKLFNAVRPDKARLLSVVKSINGQCENPLEESRLTNAFDKWWPELEVEFNKVTEYLSIDRPETEEPDVSPEHSILEEVLSLSRKTSNSLAKMEKAMEGFAKPLPPSNLRTHGDHPAKKGIAWIPITRSEDEEVDISTMIKRFRKLLEEDTPPDGVA